MSRYQPTNQRDHGGRSRNYDDRDRDNNYGSNNQRHHHSNYADNVRRFDSSRNFQRGGNDRGEPPPPGEDILGVANITSQLPVQDPGFLSFAQPMQFIPPPLCPPMNMAFHQANMQRMIPPSSNIQIIPSIISHYQRNLFQGGPQQHYGNFDQRRAFEQEQVHRQQQYYQHGQRQEYGRFDNRDRDRNNYQGRPDDRRRQQEQPQTGFCIDITPSAEPSETNLTKAFGNRQSPYYARQYYKDNVLGASEHYVNNVQFGCKLKIVEDLNAVYDDEKKGAPAPNNIETVEFFSLSDKFERKKETEEISSSDQDKGESKKESGKTVQEKVEYYNVELRNQPTNDVLWKEFVQFQERVFAEMDLDVDVDKNGPDNKAKLPKKKGRRKAMLEKQIAILDKAVESNPKNLELHILRLNIMFEVFKPNFVLTEWKKLVATTHAQIAPFWMEYLGFACSDLQIYSTSAISQSFTFAFDKFRAMISADVPQNQKPEKFLLFLADLLFSISLVLKAAGHAEKAICLQQAQLELNLNFPNNEDLKAKDVWKYTLSKLEEFWKSGVRRFGELGAQGWSNFLSSDNTSTSDSQESLTVSDNEITDFEDIFFEKLNETASESRNLRPNIHWLFLESMRSKLYWLPWREETSDVEECDDVQRVVKLNEISPYLVKIPNEIFQSEFEKHATNFRFIINNILLLREDFLPKTYTLDSILPTFTSMSLTESRTLLNEIYFWKKFLNFYHDEDCSNKVPEGFRISELNSSGYFTNSGRGSIEVTKPSVLSVFPVYTENIETKKHELLKTNQEKYLIMIRTIVEQSIEHLDTSFAVLLVQMLFRFEQKNTYASLEGHKSLMKYAKNLMKHEKLRSSCACYGEIAIIGYFGGKTDKAIELLVKTINSSRNILHSDSDGDLNLERDWELATDLCKLYRLLAEFYLKDKPELSIDILLALGNNFDSVSITAAADTEQKPKKKNVVLKAKRQFENVLKWLIPFVGDGSGITLDGEIVAIANKLDGDKCIEFMLQKANLIVEWTTAYALYQFLSNDFDAASEIYTSVFEKLKTDNCLSRASKYNSEIVSISHLREQLYLGWCKVGAMAVAQNATMNSRFRTVLGNALQEFPSSPPFLVLFSQVESQCSVAGRLWRSMLNLVKQETTQTIVTLHWTPLFMALNLAIKIDELEHDAEMSLEPFGLGGPAVPPDTIFYKLDAILTAAESNNLTKHCPLIWRVHMKHLAVRVQEGKDKNRARTLFYDAIRHCPSNKSIYLDAIAYFPSMKQEIIDLMAEKQILIRLLDEEFKLLMEIDNELKDELETSGKNKRSAPDSSQDDDDDSDVEQKPSKSKKPKKDDDLDEGEIVD